MKKKNPLLLIALGLLSSACGPSPAVGDWESADDIGGNRNEMELEEDGQGAATLYFYIDDSLFEADFDLEWEEEDNGSLIIDFECDGDCSEIDFEMECDLSSDEEEMDCDGERPFQDYEFEWERR